MTPSRIIALFLVCLGFWHPGLAQHPPSKQIDSLEAELPSLQGRARIKCLNEISEKYWWPPRVIPDSISKWARLSLAESKKINDTHGIATSYLHFGVSEIYRKNFANAETDLRYALSVFEKEQDVHGFAWSTLWLGQTLYSENNFDSSVAYFYRSLPYLAKSNDWEGEGKVKAWLGFLYETLGNYDSSFKYCRASLAIREKMSDHVCVAAALSNMGRLYMVAGDNEDALDYYLQSLQYVKRHGLDPAASNWNYLDEPVGIVYRLMHHLDSSLFYLEYALKLDPSNIMTKVSLGETLLRQNKYTEALTIFLEPIERFRKGRDEWDLMRVLHDVAQTLEEMNDHNHALTYSKQALVIATLANVKPAMMAEYKLLATEYRSLNKFDSAFNYQQKFVLLKDSLETSQFLWRLHNYKVQSDDDKKHDQIIALANENRLKEETLKRETFAKWVFVACCITLLAMGYFLYRNLTLKRKNEKLYSRQLEQTMLVNNLEAETRHAAFVQKTAELEMKVLRAQMNPHFIFNSLNSINKFILESERLTASEYLGKFSKLMRLILQNSQVPLVSMETELQALKLYIELEAFRFNDHFDYKISIPSDLDTTSLKVPPLLLQPYVENAIWHGLMQKPTKGKLDIEVTSEDSHVYIKICDDGIGRAKSKAPQMSRASEGTHKSMGLQITAERIALLDRLTGGGSYVNILDLVDADGSPAGTEVTIKIPLIYD
jgi:tetratricopeptide (TPR) repeat protein